MFIEPTAIATAAVEQAWRHRQFLFRKLARLRYRLRHGRLQVIIFGPSGAGKTTLAQFLTGRLDLPDPRNYIESLETESFSLPGNIVGDLLVAAGQERRQVRQWGDLYRSLASGTSTGVINIVAYGLHSFAEGGYREHALFREGMTVEDFLVAYAVERRARELEVLDELLPRLIDAGRPIWMITLVTKQDLWWPDRLAVRDHYTQGVYNQRITEVAQQRGQQLFAHEYLSASLVMSNLVTVAGELLIPTAAGYDQALQLAHRQKLLDQVSSFAGR